LSGVFLIILSPLILDGKKFVFRAIEGNLFILIATFGSVLQAVFGHGVLKKVNALQVSAITFLFGSLTFIPFIPKELAIWDISFLNFAGLTGIIYGVFFSTALAYFLFYYGVSKLNAQEVGIFTYIDPLAAIVVAGPLLNEYPNLFYLIGGVLIFGGIYFAEGRVHWHPFHRLKNTTNTTNK